MYSKACHVAGHPVHGVHSWQQHSSRQWRNHALHSPDLVQAAGLPSYKLPSGLTIRHTSTPAEVLFLYGEQQQYLQHGVQLQPNDTVIDIGANIGLFSMLAAEAVGAQGRVVSAEPAPQTAAALALNLQQHALWCSRQGKQVGRSVVLPVAVTDDQAGPEAQFTVYKGAAGWSTLTPDDAEVLANMKLYLRSLLGHTSTAQTHQQQQHQAAAATSQVPDSQGWSMTQRALVWWARQLARVPGVVGVTDVMGAWYVKLAMLRDAETVTVGTATVSAIIEDQQLQCVDLLKVDVERAELQVLWGIQQQHWPLIQQVTMEVHDIDGRVSQVVSLLQGHGFVHVTVDQLGHLQGTDLFNLYATRTPPQPLAQ